MNAEQTQVIQDCARGALSGEPAFAEIIGKLTEIGVERYHADYSRQEVTYYLPDGDSLLVAAPHPSQFLDRCTLSDRHERKETQWSMSHRRCVG